MQEVSTTPAEVPVEMETPKEAFAWATSTTSSSSSPVVLVLASSAVTIRLIVPPIKIRKGVLQSSPETISIAATISDERVDIDQNLRSRTVSLLMSSFTGQSLVHVVVTLMSSHANSKRDCRSMFVGPK